MKQICMIIFSVFLLSGMLKTVGQNTNASTNSTYKAGENLKYLMYYGWFDGGHASLVLNNEVIQGKDVYHVKMHAKSIGFTDRLYHVSDVYESYFNKKNGLPEKAIRNIREGKYRYYNEVVYNQEENYVVSQKSGKVTVPQNCFDILSSFYCLRNMLNDMKLVPDTIIRITSYFGDEVFPLVLRYKGKETISTKLGTVDCIKFMPVTEVGRVFKTEDDMEIWFSDDQNRLPVRVRFNLLVGSLKCDLIEFSGLKHDFHYEED
ncbi:MAG: DUF3108 domain-containing protein [Bacteroidales bacterium]|nr:DUF3108 domain-containing protein [Bacteroidales bacterium]MCF8454524.1 DUF3108 domain-containing protein [Bacteroidales bacterium]